MKEVWKTMAVLIRLLGEIKDRCCIVHICTDGEIYGTFAGMTQKQKDDLRQYYKDNYKQ